MKLYFYGFLMLIKRFIFRQNTGEVVYWFAKKMGTVYIKLAQILAMQNIGNLFTEKDRIKLSAICDECNPIRFEKIKKMIEKEYGCPIEKKFKKIYPEPIGSASISQVHKAILNNGTIVAIKIKRQDVTKKIEKDVKQISKFIRRFGRFAHFQNFLASDNALLLYLDWIKEETDFSNEMENIIKYSRYAKSVNGKVDDTVNIVIPKVHRNLCTDNILVMDFVFSKTINQLTLTSANKKRVAKCLDDYLHLSFYALFNGNTVFFHGDPHGGNIFIDPQGNVGFLDMGLLFELDKEEVAFVKKLFFYAYNEKYKKLYDLLLSNSVYTAYDEIALEEDLKKMTQRFKTMPVTNFFVGMIGIFTHYNVEPPDVLFKLAKAFMALYGINSFVGNKKSAEELLTSQIIEYYVGRTLNDFKELTTQARVLIPDLLQTIEEKGLVKGITKEILAIQELTKKVNEAKENWEEVIDYFS